MDKEKIVLKNIGKYLKKLNNDLKNWISIKIILHMAKIIYLMKKIITNQQKSRALLMITMYYMKVGKVKMVN